MKYPFTVIKQFFEIWHLHGARQDLQRWIDSAMSEEYKWNQGSPGNLLFFYDHLKELIAIAREIIQERKKNNVKDEDDEFEDAFDLIRILEKRTKDLEDFPMNLTLEEMCFPYRVLRSFFKYKTITAWYEELHRWLGMALSNDSIAQDENPEEIFPVTEHLFKLIDTMNVILAIEQSKKS